MENFFEAEPVGSAPVVPPAVDTAASTPVTAVETRIALSSSAVVDVTELSLRPGGVLLSLRLTGRNGFDIASAYLDLEDWLSGAPRPSLRYESLPDELFRFAVRYPDGRAATSLGTLLGPRTLSLVPVSAWGRSGTMEERWWLAPDPAAEFTIQTDWPAAEISLQTSTVVMTPPDDAGPD